MKCGRCEGEYREVIEPRTFKVRGRRVTVPVAGLRCDGCGEILYTPEQADRAQLAACAEIRADRGNAERLGQWSDVR
jgi:YgiT-type zinc finger domain-containing protein